ncbi:hypothetical protein [Pseudoxanthomonas mexicana]|uniref:hypothetical protein n=1 Tax=Pseudoxanthomonas mexicana TaxID=128785 RepID=UPI0018DB12CF|nr:hypothetical protein [Pseudoxanthomonas mexicana]
MCGFCIEDIYFNGQSSGSFFAERCIGLMETADWHIYYSELSDPSEIEMLIALGRELDGYIHWTRNQAISHQIPPPTWQALVKPLAETVPDAAFLPMLGDFNMVPFDLSRHQAAADAFLAEVANRYFVIENDHHRLEGDWSPWIPQEEPARLFWAYICVVISGAGGHGKRWLYELAFAATKRTPSFLGMELWVQRRAATLLVMSDGPGVFHPRAPVRSALVQCAHAAVARKLDELERTLTELQNVEQTDS